MAEKDPSPQPTRALDSSPLPSTGQGHRSPNIWSSRLPLFYEQTAKKNSSIFFAGGGCRG